jgi:hypothetical protein
MILYLLFIIPILVQSGHFGLINDRTLQSIFPGIQDRKKFIFLLETEFGDADYLLARNFLFQTGLLDTAEFIRGIKALKTFLASIKCESYVGELEKLKDYIEVNPIDENIEIIPMALISHLLTQKTEPESKEKEMILEIIKIANNRKQESFLASKNLVFKDHILSNDLEVYDKLNQSIWNPNVRPPKAEPYFFQALRMVLSKRIKIFASSNNSIKVGNYVAKTLETFQKSLDWVLTQHNIQFQSYFTNNIYTEVYRWELVKQFKIKDDRAEFKELFEYFIIYGAFFGTVPSCADPFNKSQVMKAFFSNLIGILNQIKFLMVRKRTLLVPEEINDLYCGGILNLGVNFINKIADCLSESGYGNSQFLEAIKAGLEAILKEARVIPLKEPNPEIRVDLYNEFNPTVVFNYFGDNWKLPFPYQILFVQQLFKLTVEYLSYDTDQQSLELIQGLAAKLTGQISSMHAHKIPANYIFHMNILTEFYTKFLHIFKTPLLFPPLTLNADPQAEKKAAILKRWSLYRLVLSKFPDKNSVKDVIANFDMEISLFDLYGGILEGG